MELSAKVYTSSKQLAKQHVYWQQSKLHFNSAAETAGAAGARTANSALKASLAIARTKGSTGVRTTSLTRTAVSAGARSSDYIIKLDDSTSYQTLLGFGASFTEASGYVLSHLDKKEQEKIVNAYFGNKGLNYTFCRTHMQSCDFSLGHYSYIIDKDDTALKSFSLARDHQYLIPFIKLAQKLSAQKFTLMATPWSPPPFMKTNNSMAYGGKLKPEYAEMWAQMYAKYILEYKKLGIDIWGLSIQNEPEAKQTWESCLYDAEEEGNFIYKHLVPALRKNKLSPKIIAWDHNRDQLYKRAKIIYKHQAAKHIWGSAVHWYEEIFKGRPMHETMAKTHALFPDKHIIMSEGCQELFGGKVSMGDWSIGERYARNIIGDLNAWCVGWIDWNMVLDSTGGPNHVGNLCDAPVKVDLRTKEVSYANSFYYIGHFSKFINPGAKRIKHSTNAPFTIFTTAFKQDNQIVLVVLNTDSRPQEIQLLYKKQQSLIMLAAHSIQTIIIEQKITF